MCNAFFQLQIIVKAYFFCKKGKNGLADETKVKQKSWIYPKNYKLTLRIKILCIM